MHTSLTMKTSTAVTTATMKTMAMATLRVGARNKGSDAAVRVGPVLTRFLRTENRT
jgi:hypothetical protein